MPGSRRPIFVNPNPTTTSLGGLPRVQAFHEHFPGYAASPLVPLPDIADELGVRAVYVKQESNRFGLPSFKVLGASWAIYQAVLAALGLPDGTPLETLIARVQASAASAAITLIAATEGNHGRAVARVAQQMSLQCRIYVPCTMHEYTKQMIQSEGAEVVVVEGDYDRAVQAAADSAAEMEQRILIQDTAFEGYEDIPAWVVEGYSTLLREADEQLHALGLLNTLVVAPVGVGSFGQAVATYYKSRETPAAVVAVEPDTAPSLTHSLQQGKLTSVITSPSIMAGMNCGTVSSVAWPLLQQLVDASVTVSDWESHGAVQDLTAQSVDAGPCGAASLAAIRRLKAEHHGSAFFTPESVILLLSTEGRRPYEVPQDVSTDDPVKLTQMLTRINSSNPTLSKSRGAGETAIVNYLSAWFSHRAIEHHRIETTPGRPSVVGIVRGSGRGSSIMLNGHVDTVSLTTYEGDALTGHRGVKEGKEVVFGRGVLDMKAGLAAGLSALLVAKESPLAGDVMIAAVADEEDASQGTIDVLAAGWRADAGVVLEPTNLAIAHAHKGFAWAEVEILGRAAHGSQPADGIDAIMNMGLFLQALRETQAQLPVDAVLGQGSLHCGIVHGGEEASSYPASCKLTVEYRTVPVQTNQGILDDLGALLDRLARENAGFQYREPRITMSRPSQHVPHDHPLVEQLVHISQDVIGHPAAVQSVPFWCDAALLTEAGIPSIVFGPCGAGLHSREEWVEVDSLPAFRFYSSSSSFSSPSSSFPAPIFLLAPFPSSVFFHNGFSYICVSRILNYQAGNLGFAMEASFPDSSRASFDDDWAEWLSTSDSIHPDTFSYPAGPVENTSLDPVIPGETRRDFAETDPTNHSSIRPTDDFSVSRWLEGAYRPSVPCAHCQQHRLQCLIIRTTPANPNPVSSCSSCVALFRECSLARGEKRHPAGFETFFPVFNHLHGVTDENDGRHKPRFSRKGAKVLRDWLYRNQHAPYPTEEQKAQFAQQTGLTEKQISTWFANARRRHRVARRTSRPSQIFRSGSPMPVSRPPTLTPMERWQRSPPDQEPVSESAIQDAIAAAGTDTAWDCPSASADASPGAHNLASSISSMDSEPSHASSESVSSAWSHRSESYLPFPLSDVPSRSQSRRRRPRRRSAAEGPFQCTFCVDSFKKKHDWARHEKSVHLSLESWICTIGPDILDIAGSEALPCDFCNATQGFQSHFATHEFDVCVDRPLSERSFCRKDHLIQHLRKFHHCTKVPALRVEACRVVTNDVESRCGFCQLVMSTWSERADHLAEHFKSGARMMEWCGDWGLDTLHQAMLRDAMLPADRFSLSEGVS
ncbi:hypothetical protein BO94DRAFT_462894 [Aspergillus sclerotioniger CBS 115572]|uniref:Acetylornithine deacetylase n=1 Tax=Aspergillus sclerotioniger CBS 115572 TaxID=1450535 RepID=A0A317WVJ7_9EURO|nr:hypothetical protein BO94DRAFT_462894 [Aspergillus sclerotioniger CBS 115572]PWY90373.1 hypothetical protein BO94DRAFT_462894 [Aspergillus sclerotioniger CBS 115572]